MPEKRLRSLAAKKVVLRLFISLVKRMRAVAQYSDNYCNATYIDIDPQIEQENVKVARGAFLYT